MYAAERVTGTFERSVRLPEFVDGERISAEFTNGVLTVTVPKAQAAQPRKIEIKPGGASEQLSRDREYAAFRRSAERENASGRRMSPLAFLHPRLLLTMSRSTRD